MVMLIYSNGNVDSNVMLMLYTNVILNTRGSNGWGKNKRKYGDVDSNVDNLMVMSVVNGNVLVMLH